MRSARTATWPGRGCAATAGDEPYECHRDDPDLHEAAAMTESAGSTKQSMTMVTNHETTTKGMRARTTMAAKTPEGRPRE